MAYEDPYLDPTKKKPLSAVASLPQITANNGIVPLTSDAMSGKAVAPTQSATEQANTAVLAQAQTNVLNQPGESDLQKATTSQAMNFVQNPMGDYDAAKNKQQRMEKANTDWANSFEAMRRQYGNISGSGLLQQNMLQNQLGHNVEMGALESDLDTDAYNKYIDSMTKAIATGQGQTQSNENIFSQRLQNAAGVRAMAEGERAQTSEQTFGEKMTGIENAFKLEYLAADQAGQAALTELKGNIDKGMLITQQDFQGTQAALDRALEDAKMKGDWASVENITKLKGQIDAMAQEKQNEFIAIQSSLDRENQTALMQLKGDIDKGMLLTQQDFAGLQSGLDRDLEKYKAAGDWANAEKITTLKGQIDAQAQKSQQEWSTAERTASQLWTSTEKVSDRDHDLSLQYLDQQNAIAMQENDITAQKDIQQMRSDLELTMQTQDMGFAEKMAYVDATLEEAKAKRDQTRVLEVEKFRSQEQFKMLESTQGHDVAMANLNNELDLALQRGEFDNAIQLQQFKFINEKEMQAENIRVEEMKIAIQQQGIDMAEVQQQYENIMGQVAAGQLSPDAGVKYLESKLPAELFGKDGALQPPSPTAWMDSMKEDYLMQQYQFATTHGGIEEIGEFETDEKGDKVFVGLKPEYAQQYNDFVNKTQYQTAEGPQGQLLAEIRDGTRNVLSETTRNDTQDPVYQALLQDPSTLELDFAENMTGHGASKRSVYSNMPPVNGYFKYNGMLFQLKGKETDNVAFSTDSKIYHVTNVLTGKTVTINTRDSRDGNANILINSGPQMPGPIPSGSAIS